MTLSIRDPETDRLARELAAKHGKPITDVVRLALEDFARKPVQGDLAVRNARLDALLGRIRARLPKDGPTPKEIMDDLYDDDGLPR
jgi:antitoxin VapB